MYPEIVRNLMINRLDELEKLIKPLENEYKELSYLLTEGEDMKCSKCKQEKDDSYFYPNYLWCRDCKNKAARLRYARIREKKKEEAVEMIPEEPKKSVDEVSVEACKKGLSYGKYVAMKERGMRIE